MNFDPKTGVVKLHKNQQQLLREANNLVTMLVKVDPIVTGLKQAIDRYCEPEADGGKGGK